MFDFKEEILVMTDSNNTDVLSLNFEYNLMKFLVLTTFIVNETKCDLLKCDLGSIVCCLAQL